ncbi:TlpA family protein disulfide reductase [Chitinophaga sp. NPDC101104]|uniref:TlpA family protein disulfide reductase n=1 Tax=Chitinophaga sp. NPDC101104 TaxID=3390561 RepID=UPI003D078F5F
MKIIKLITIFSFLILIIFLPATKSLSIPFNRYLIEGKIFGIPDNTPVYLIKKNDTIATSITKNSKFKFEHTENSNGNYVFIKIDTSKIKLKENTPTWMILILDSARISISGNLNEWPNNSILGSNATNAYHKLVNEINQMRSYYDSIVISRKVAPDTVDLLRSDYKSKLIAILKKYPTDLATPLIASNMKMSLELDGLNEIYESFPDKIKDSYGGHLVKKDINSLKSVNYIKKEKRLPPFYFTNDSGIKVSIQELVKTNKLTLIDFWASWCSPCRKHFPQLKEVYEKFKKDGFNLVSISIDDDQSKWINAMKKDNNPWIQGIEGEQKISSDLFGITGIPAYFLVNSTGDIVAAYAPFDFSPYGPLIKPDSLYQTISSLLK